MAKLTRTSDKPDVQDKSPNPALQTPAKQSPQMNQQQPAPVKPAEDLPEQILDERSEDLSRIQSPTLSENNSPPSTRKRGRAKEPSFTQKALAIAEGPKEKRKAKKKKPKDKPAAKDGVAEDKPKEKKVKDKKPKVQVNHLSERLKNELKDQESYFGGIIAQYIDQALAYESSNVLAQMRAKHCEENFAQRFWEIVPQYIGGYNTDDAQKMRDTDGVSLLELCFKLIPSTHEDVNKKITLFQAFCKVLDGNVMPDYISIDDVVTQPTQEILIFLEDLWKWIIAVPDKTPKYQLVYLCTKWGIGCKLALLSYAKAPDSWSMLKHIQNVKYQNPSSRKKHLHVSDIFWALSNKYQKILPNYLKMIFYRPKMLLHEEVLVAMENTHNDYVGIACGAVIGGCFDTADSGSLFIELMQLLGKYWHLKELAIVLTPMGSKKIDIGNFVTVMNGLAQLQPSFAEAICKKYKNNVYEVMANLEHERDNREQENIDQKKVAAELDKRNSNLNAEEKEALNLAEQASDWLIQQHNGPYRRQPLQMHMVARITGTKGLKFTLSEHPPGTGKSWIIAILIAAYFRKSDKLRFLVLTCNPMLQTQLMQQIQPYLKKIQIAFSVNQLPTTALARKNLIVIIDEYDAWLNEFAVTIEGKAIKGLNTLRECTKVHMLTATATEFTRDVHRILMKEQADASFFTFEAKEELSEAGKNAQQQMLISKTDDKEFIFEEFRRIIRKEQLDKPVIIFTEEEEKRWFDELKMEYGKDVEVIWINDLNEADAQRGRDKGKQRGIYVIGTKWSRGYDLKLAKDAIVLVLAYEKGFPLSQVNQMFGRGSRSFGISRGFYFTWKFPTPCFMKEQLLLKEKKYYDAHKILEMLLDTVGSIDFTKDWRYIQDGFAKPQLWHKTIADFEADHPSCFQLIAKQMIEKQRNQEEVSLADL